MGKDFVKQLEVVEYAQIAGFIGILVSLVILCFMFVPLIMWFAMVMVIAYKDTLWHWIKPIMAKYGLDVYTQEQVRELDRQRELALDKIEWIR